MNPINAPLYDLLHHLNTLNGLLLNFNDQLNSFEKMYRESISKTSFGIATIFSGSSLAIRDLTEWPENNVAKYYSSGTFSVKGEEYFKLLRILLAREASLTISQACESFETFLKNTLTILLLENYQLAETNKVEKFESDKKSINLNKTEFAFWRAYLDYYYKTNTLRLKFLRKICPEIYKSETKNNRPIDLTNWFAIVEEVRNSATHSNFIIKNNRIKNWSEAKKEMLKKYFHGNRFWYGYELDVTIENARFSLTLFAEYAFQIYKFISISESYDWDILQKQKRE